MSTERFSSKGDDLVALYQVLKSYKQYMDEHKTTTTSNPIRSVSHRDEDEGKTYLQSKYKDSQSRKHGDQAGIYSLVDNLVGKIPPSSNQIDPNGLIGQYYQDQISLQILIKNLEQLAQALKKHGAQKTRWVSATQEKDKPLEAIDTFIKKYKGHMIANQVQRAADVANQSNKKLEAIWKQRQKQPEKKETESQQRDDDPRTTRKPS
jgi:hypothetical protein